VLKPTEAGAKEKARKKPNCGEYKMAFIESKWEEESAPPEAALIQALEAKIGDTIVLVYNNTSGMLTRGMNISEPSEPALTQLKDITSACDSYYITLQVTEIYVPGAKH
jgi:hypothetical protein